MDRCRAEEIRNRTDAYLHEIGMHSSGVDFDRNVEVMLEEMQAGLSGAPSPLAMIPTYIEAEEEVPRETPVIVLDAGGTNFRTAVVTFGSDGTPRIESFQKHPMPGSTGYVAKEEFFDSIAEKTAGVYDSSGSIGFCFSYPTEILPNRDGKLLHFSKEIKAPEVEGQYIASNLRSALSRKGLSGDPHIIILNDTVATLLAAKTAGSKEHFDTYLGFILGTGLNCAYIERNHNIKKIDDLVPERSQIINMESGGYDGFGGGEVDEEFDAGTKSPGMYRLEKMVSGAYLGPLGGTLLQRAVRDGLFSPETSGKIAALGNLDTVTMDGFLHNPETGSLAEACGNEEDRLIAFTLLENIVERAGKLAAVNIASAVLQSGAGTDPSRPGAVCADGTTFYKTHRLKFYTEYYLKKELEERRGRYVQLIGLDNAPVIGAAVAGLTN